MTAKKQFWLNSVIYNYTGQKYGIRTIKDWNYAISIYKKKKNIKRVNYKTLDPDEVIACYNMRFA